MRNRSQSKPAFVIVRTLWGYRPGFEADSDIFSSGRSVAVPVRCSLRGPHAPANAWSVGGQVGAASTFKVAPLIVRPFTAQEIRYLSFDLKQNFEKMEVLQALDKWQIEHFAEASFRKHHRESRVQGKTIPVENLVSFSPVPLKKPLLKEVPTALKRTGAHRFDLLLESMGVRPCKTQVACLREIFYILRTSNPILIDEFFFLWIEQTINNRSVLTLLWAWEVFLIMATLFPHPNRTIPKFSARLRVQSPTPTSASPSLPHLFSFVSRPATTSGCRSITATTKPIPSGSLAS
jgi:hypothetical protein